MSSLHRLLLVICHGNGQCTFDSREDYGKAS